MPELARAGIVNVHSKVVVLDPFGPNPVVMTGSHNCGFKASSENDDNLVIIEGNAPLAAAYAINIIAIYQTYRWNHYAELHRQDPRVWHGLVDNDTWQNSYLTGEELTELKFWMGHAPASAATPPFAEGHAATQAPAARIRAATSHPRARKSGPAATTTGADKLAHV